jgi:3-methylcrotonyl-CoA carboxylase beta subunit
MGAQQAGQVLVTVKQQQRARDPLSPYPTTNGGGSPDSTARQFEQEGSPYFSSARLWDDGILDPMETRRAIGICLDIATAAPSKDSRAPVFRM